MRPVRALAIAALVVLPVAILGAAELVLRSRGLGGYPPVVERIGPAGGHVWFATNRRGTDTFFQVGHAVGGGMRELQFVTPKPRDTVRIIFLGESAIQGFPQQLPLTNGSFLEAMLGDAWGDGRTVEVLNLGATAVASFPIACYSGEVLEHEPDLVVLMAGSNEFYGAYGVASIPAIARSPAGMRALRWVRGLAVSQWLHSRVVPAPTAGGTLMERAAAGRAITHDDPRRAAAERTLRAHLRAIVERCAARDVPIIVCTVPTNECGMAPIGVDREPASLAASSLEAFRADLHSAEALLDTDPLSAGERARAALALHDGHARGHFLLGEALRRQGEGSAALAEYVRARDLDPMPWRATSAAGDAARAAVAGVAGASLCDMEAAFRTESPGGAIGWELMDDHVHMSLRGQALFARTIAGAMAAMPGPLRVDPQALAALRSWEHYADRLGRGVHSDYVAATHIQKLFAAPFMRAQNETAFERADARCRELLASMSALDREAVERWWDPTLHGASDRPLEFVAGAYHLKAGDYETAARLLRIARRGVPAISSWRLELTWLLLRCHRHLHAEPTVEDRQLCQEAIGVGELLNRYSQPGDPRVLRYLGLAYNLAGNHPAAISALEPITASSSGAEGWEVVAALADSYVRVGNGDAARLVLDAASRDPETGEAAQSLLRQLDAGEGAFLTRPD